MNYYKCTVSNPEKEYNGGIWLRKETEKTIKLELFLVDTINPNPYQRNYKREEGKPVFMFYKNNKKLVHGIREWEDGTFTVYPYFEGIPYYFEPLTNKDEISILVN